MKWEHRWSPTDPPMALEPAQPAASAAGLDNLPVTAPGALSKWAVLDELRRFTTLSRQRMCMVSRRGATVVVGRTAGRMHVSGALPCNGRLCPNCAPLIQAGRRDEIQECVEGARHIGWVALFLTLTIGHSREDRLADLLDALGSAWRGMTRGGWWSRMKAAHGVRHHVRVVEVQEGGANGWHPHLHVLLFLDTAAAEAYSLDGLATSITDEWSRVVDVAGYRATAAAQRLVEPTGEHLDRMAGYFTKQAGDGLAWEMTGQATKNGRNGSRNPAQLLVDAVNGDDAAVTAWQELEEAIHGSRLIAYSAHCRRDLRLPPTVRAEDHVADLTVQPVEQLVCVDGADFEDRAGRYGFRAALEVVVVAAQSTDEIVWWLHDRGVRAWPIPPQEVPARVVIPPGPEGREWLAEP